MTSAHTEEFKKRQAELNTTHGLSRTKAYRTFHGMKQRCYNTNNPEYKNYGGRGIKICDEWLNDVSKFWEWVLENGWDENKSRDDQSIDRINVNGNYCPENCRIIPMSQQHYNRTDTHYITVNGITKTLQEWSDMYGVSPSLINYRLASGWSAEDAVLKSVKEMKERIGEITFNGRTMLLTDWARELNIPASTLANRLNSLGWNVEKAMTEPPKNLKKNIIDETEYDSICERYKSGERAKEIAETYNVSICVISRIIKIGGISERHRFNKYNIDLSELLEDFKSGKANKELAEKYGCSTSLIGTRKLQFRKKGLL